MPDYDNAAVERLGRAAADNVLALIVEADLLHEHGHTARSFVLTVLAAEELAKAWVAFMAQQFEEDPDLWSTFDEVVKGHHVDKLQSMLRIDMIASILTGQVPDDTAKAIRALEARDVYAMKNRAMYVDLIDGEPQGPDLIANDAEAQRQAALIRKSATVWAIALGGTLGDDEPEAEGGAGPAWD